MGWVLLIFFGCIALLMFNRGKSGLGVMGVILAVIGIMMILQMGPFKYPGYTNGRQAINFVEKHDHTQIVLYTVDDEYGNGPTDGNSVYLLKNTKKNGYVFKYDGKYFYLLQRITYITDVGDPYSSYRYQVDAIPVDQKGDLPMKYVNVDGKLYTQGKSTTAIGDDYTTAVK